VIYSWSRRGRRPVVLWGLATLWGLALCFWLVFDAAWFVSALIAASTLPALYDYWRNQTALVEIHPGRVSWCSSLVDGDRTDIDHVRLNRQFNGSMKITLIHPDGTHTRLPPDITPPITEFETALSSAGISAQRHPFTAL